MTSEKTRPLHASEIALNEAEAEAALGLAKLYATQARKELALAKAEEDTFAVQRLDRDRAKEKRDRELAADDRHHVYQFAAAVDATSAAKCISQLNLWRRLEPECPIEIEFYSPGGNVFAGMQLFDHIIATRQAGHRVTTSTRGYAASMAGILLQAGDWRVIGPESYLLIHEISSLTGGKLPEIVDEVEFMKKIEKRVLKIFAARSTLSEGQIRARMNRKDWWLDSDDCLKLGFVDEIQ